MKIVVFDPGLSEFGHHVHFNKHVITLLDAVGVSVQFLDINGLLKKEGKWKNVAFTNIDAKMFGDSPKSLNGQDYAQQQKSAEKCRKFWAYIESLKPDFVIQTSEGVSRVPLYSTLPSGLSRRVFVIAHAVWSFLRSFNANDVFRKSVLEKLAGVFVIEPFLMDSLLGKGIKTFWFPHRSYSEKNLTVFKNKLRIPSEVKKVGTFGVINERRNNEFLISAIAGMKRAGALHYIVAGQLMPAVKDSVLREVERFQASATNHRIELIPEYLPDEKLAQYLQEIDCALLAYDSERNLQASGAVYTHTEAGVLLLLPRIRLFECYEKLWPGLFLFYEPLNKEDLEERLLELQDSTKCKEVFDRFSNAREAFLRDNSLSRHVEYLRRFFEKYRNSHQDVSIKSWFSIGNEYVRARKYLEAEACYLAAIGDESRFSQSYANCSYLRSRRSDYVGSSLVSTLRISNTGVDILDRGFELKDKKPFSVLVWPPFKTNDEYSDFIKRFAWHFLPIAEYVKELWAFSESYVAGSIKKAPCIGEEASNAVRFFEDKIRWGRPDELKEASKEVSFSLVWKYTSPEERQFPFPKDCPLLYKKTIWRVDEKRERFATSHYLKAVSSLVDVEKTRKSAFEKFLRLREKFTSKRIAVFGTGPSLSKAFAESFDGVDTIAANSMVKNLPMLDHLKPKLIVCADPIFHAGVSTYAEEFRHMLRTAINRYECPLMVPERDLHIYHNYFHKDGIEVIPVPFVVRDEPNYSMLEDFSVTSTGNILTLMLLQVAFSFVDEVDIYGCDGRPENENTYFWGHDKTVQINERMDDIKFAHPGFFDISYDDYYSEHCSTVDKWLKHAEAQGKRARSRTFSYIRALKSREQDLLE